MDSAHLTPSSIADPAALYGHCLDAHSIQEVLGYGLQYLSTIVQASQLTYVDIHTPTVRCVGATPNEALTVRMLAHARRCLEGVDKHEFDAQSLTLETHVQRLAVAYFGRGTSALVHQTNLSAVPLAVVMLAHAQITTCLSRLSPYLMLLSANCPSRLSTYLAVSDGFLYTHSKPFLW